MILIILVSKPSMSSLCTPKNESHHRNGLCFCLLWGCVVWDVIDFVEPFPWNIDCLIVFIVLSLPHFGYPGSRQVHLLSFHAFDLASILHFYSPFSFPFQLLTNIYDYMKTLSSVSKCVISTIRDREIEFEFNEMR